MYCKQKPGRVAAGADRAINVGAAGGRLQPGEHGLVKNWNMPGETGAVLHGA